MPAFTTAVITVKELRDALKGVKGNEEIKIKVPYKDGSHFVSNIARVQYDKNWKSWFIFSSGIG